MTISLRHFSQGTAAMRLRGGGIFNNHFIVHLSRRLAMKEF